MNAAAGLTVHLLAYWAFVWLVLPPAVAFRSWVAVYGLGVLALLVLWRRDPAEAQLQPSVKAFLYSVFVAGIFFGADQTLTVLGNSVKPRQALPEFLGGLELYYLLVPGVAAAALGNLAAAIRAKRKSTRVGPVAHLLRMD